MKRFLWSLCVLAIVSLSLAGCASSNQGKVESLPSGNSSWEKIAEVKDNAFVTRVYRVKAADGNEYIVTRCSDGVSVFPAPPAGQVSFRKPSARPGTSSQVLVRCAELPSKTPAMP